MICPKCGNDKPISDYYVKKSHKGSWCKECLLESRRKWARENPEKARANKQRYYSANKEKLREQAKARYAKRRSSHPEKQHASWKNWKEKNPEKVKAQNARRRRLEVDELRDRYIKKVLRLPVGAPVPVELIEATRAMLKLKRLIKEMK